MDFDWNCLLGKFQPAHIVHHVVGDVNIDAQEKLFVLTTFSGFVGLCRVGIM